MQRDKRSIDELISAHESGYSLEQRFYTDPDIYSLELEKVVTNHWILAGHQSELPEPGDFKVLNVAGDSAIVVRGSDGVLKGFANVCRHRGSLVCLEEKGSVSKFTCPYHGWMYDIDGNLLAARDMQPDFDKSAHGLGKIAVDTVQGLLLVCFGPEPPSLEALKRDLAEAMAMFAFENLKVAAHKQYAIPANWKLAVENYQECYHCATAHPDYAKMHTLMLDDRKRQRAQAHMRGRMPACGLRDIRVDHVGDELAANEIPYGYWRTAMFDGYLTGSRDGAPVAPLLGELTEYDCGASDIVLGPLSFLLAYSDHVVAYVFTPVDIANSRCDIYWLVRADAEKDKDYDVDELTWLWDITTESDKEIIVNNWRGVQSRYYRPGPLAKMEYPERWYIEWLLRALQRD